MKRLALCLALMLCAAAPAWSQTVLRYSNWLPAKHQMHTEVFVPWMAEVEKATEGRVKFEILPKMVGTVPTQFDVLRDGLADMAVFVPGFSPGRFDLIEMAELPLVADEPNVMAPAVQQLYTKHLAKYNEFKGVHIVSIFSTAAGHVYTAKKPVRSMADFKGVKLRTSLAANSPAVTALGAVPVQKGTNEIYELVSSGVLDGTLLSKEAVVSFSLVNTLNNLTIIPGGIYNSVLSLAINEDKWKSLSPKDQDIITKLSGDLMAKEVGKAYSKADANAVDTMKQAGKTVIVAEGDFYKQIKQALSYAESTWIAKAKKKGMAEPEKVLAEFRADIAARYKALGIPMLGQ
ncbi:TRAP transporter substrate-binding protein [Variovorax sp. KK3]|uniref:TRAP transporter substrate-binding protein n=1 Tax=Variovorax sp. KK3 TaxID=1855728 RepID=UPI00097BB04D|nr:TRAP transporter substrate-binding protein [Variovorax sp. KK3]